MPPDSSPAHDAAPAGASPGAAAAPAHTAHHHTQLAGFSLPHGVSALHSHSLRCCGLRDSSATFVVGPLTVSWTARKHRKGRYPVLLEAAYKQVRLHPVRLLPWLDSDWRDLSLWVALIFTLGCVAWVVNGHLALAARSSGAAIAALVGGTLFEVGSWLLYFECVNQHPAIVTGRQLLRQSQLPPLPQPSAASAWLRQFGSDGSAWLRRVSSGGKAPSVSCAGAASAATTAASAGTIAACNNGSAGNNSSSVSITAGTINGGQPQDELVLMPVENMSPHRLERQSLLVASEQHQQQQQLAKQQQPAKQQPPQQQPWKWVGWRPRDAGFWACFLQLVGATVFWIPCIFGTPGVAGEETATNYQLYNGLYWGTQVAGASFFVVSSLLFILEEQPSLWQPRPLRLGWQIGWWNFVGAWGFWLSGVFGFWAQPAEKLQLGGTVASTVWGSYAFLLGSYLQLIEALNKHPDSMAVAVGADRRRAARAADVISAGGGGRAAGGGGGAASDGPGSGRSGCWMA